MWLDRGKRTDRKTHRWGVFNHVWRNTDHVLHCFMSSRACQQHFGPSHRPYLRTKEFIDLSGILLQCGSHGRHSVSGRTDGAMRRQKSGFLLVLSVMIGRWLRKHFPNHVKTGIWNNPPYSSAAFVDCPGVRAQTAILGWRRKGVDLCEALFHFAYCLVTQSLAHYQVRP